MQALELLNDYKKKVEPFLSQYFEKKINQSEQIDPIAGQTVRMIRDFTLAGGKRIRPAVLYYAFLATGGKPSDKIIEASMAVELLHTFLLIHDDIIDRDAIRHGVQTLHERYKDLIKNVQIKKLQTEIDHFGNSMAIIAGDMASSMACEIIFNSAFDPKLIIRALDKLQNIVFVTIPGEMLDVVMEYLGQATEESILKMHEGKTARYTFEGPMHLGCMLADADAQYLQQFSQYALPLGVAFQLRDDILGLFGEEKKLGKPIASDIIEGKQTLLIIKALEFGTKQDKEFIQKHLGNKQITQHQILEFTEIIRRTGSLDYSHQLAEKLIQEALTELEKIDFKNEEARIFFHGIAEYMLKREK